jgi:hypothetical protein
VSIGLETGRNALRDKLVCDIFYLDGSTPQLGKRPLWQWLVDAVPDNKPLEHSFSVTLKKPVRSGAVERVYKACHFLRTWRKLVGSALDLEA